MIETRTVVRVECPAEVTADQPAEVAAYAGGPVDAPSEFWSWLGAHLRREATLGARIGDARATCDDIKKPDVK